MGIASEEKPNIFSILCAWLGALAKPFVLPRFKVLTWAKGACPHSGWVRKHWALAALSVIRRHCTGFDNVEGLVDARQEINALGCLARDHADEAILREYWAKSFVIYTRSNSNLSHLEATCQFASILDGVIEAYPDEPILRTHWGMVVAGLIVDNGFVEDFEMAVKLLKSLEETSEAYPEEPILREYWAVAVYGILIDYNVAEEIGAVVDLMAALEALCDAHPDEEVLREMWSYAACNTISHCVVTLQFTSVDGRGDGTGIGRADGGAGGWVDALSVFARRYPHDAALQEKAADMEEFRKDSYGADSGA